LFFFNVDLFWGFCGIENECNWNSNELVDGDFFVIENEMQFE